jgi:hypothetical protein
MGVITQVLKHTPLLKQPGQAAESIVWAATAPEPQATPGALYLRHKQLTLKGAATDATQTRWAGPGHLEDAGFDGAPRVRGLRELISAADGTTVSVRRRLRRSALRDA